MASPSISSLILLPIITPPASSTMLYVMPNSSRSISPVAEKPKTSWPYGLTVVPSNSTFSSTGTVVVLIVRSPRRVNSLPPFGVRPVLTNSIVGCACASKKSALRRWLSRASTPVETLSTTMLASTRDWTGSSATVILPLTSWKAPRTLLTIKWRATKPTRVWAGSRENVPAAGILRPWYSRVELSAMVISPLDDIRCAGNYIPDTCCSVNYCYTRWHGTRDHRRPPHHRCRSTQRGLSWPHRKTRVPDRSIRTVAHRVRGAAPSRPLAQRPAPDDRSGRTDVADRERRDTGCRSTGTRHTCETYGVSVRPAKPLHRDHPVGSREAECGASRSRKAYRRVVHRAADAGGAGRFAVGPAYAARRGPSRCRG